MQANSLEDYVLRDALDADLPSIFGIFNDEIRSGVNTFKLEPVQEAGQRDWWMQHRSDTYPVIVAQRQGAVAGWASLSPWSLVNGGYYLTAEVSLWVASPHRGIGLGKRFLGELIRRGRSAGLRVLVSKIEASNAASISLHHQFDFKDVGVLHRVGQKFQRPLDVALLELQLIDDHPH